MFASKHPLYFFFLVFCIVAAVIVTMVMTSNPLALLGLFFLPDIPVVNPPAGDDMDGDDADGNGIGFTANL